MRVQGHRGDENKLIASEAVSLGGSHTQAWHWCFHSSTDEMYLRPFSVASTETKLPWVIDNFTHSLNAYDKKAFLDAFINHADGIDGVSCYLSVGNEQTSLMHFLSLRTRTSSQNVGLDLAPKVEGIALAPLITYASSSLEDKVISGQDVKLLLDALHSAVCYLDCWGVVREVNKSAIMIMGGNEAYTDKHFVEYAHHWDDPTERWREIMHVIRTGIALVGSVESAIINDVKCWFSVDKVATKDQQGNVNGILLTMHDITKQRQQEMKLLDTEARYKALSVNSTDAVWCYDIVAPVDLNLPVEKKVELIVKNSALVDCNQVMLDMFGLTSKEKILGRSLGEVGSKNHFLDIQTFIEKGYQLIDHEIVQETRKGGKTFQQISCAGVLDNGRLIRVWGVTKDVTMLRRYEAKLHYQATHDGLTSLPNRNYLYERIESFIQNRSVNQQCALLIIDLDRFKEINDTLGHQVGDQLLQLIGPRLDVELSDINSVIARLGGDEFAILLQGIRNSQQAIVLAHRVLDALCEEFELEGLTTEISASIGISLCPAQASDVSTLMRYADVAMYRAKQEMSGISLYNSNFDLHSPKRLSMINDLAKAIRKNQLELYFQPKIDLKRCCFYGFEALLRWTHPKVGFVSPVEFIPIIEMTKLIYPLTEWVLETAAKQCKCWHDKGFDLSVAVNLSAQNLLDDTIAMTVARILKKHQLPPSALELEITESAIMTDPKRAMRNLECLHSLGVTLSIDDFGTGYSSLGYLKKMPVQTLKIDNSFVRQMLEVEQDEIIVNSTIHLAHNLGLRVVAEGVEDQALMNRLVELGCDEAQGYFIGRPMPALQAEKWLREFSWQQLKIG